MFDDVTVMRLVPLIDGVFHQLFVLYVQHVIV